MFRSILTLALSVFLLAEASAQTTPVAAKKKTTKTVKASARAAKKARRVALKTTPTTPVMNDGWPPLETTPSAVAATNPATDGGWGSVNPAASTSRGEIDNANVYAAPGMPVHMRTSNGMVPYSVRPLRKSAATQTTLGN
ncbi:hypothetical protein ACVWYF_004266 [Hymenobacter sp. UYAg731]